MYNTLETHLISQGNSAPEAKYVVRNEDDENIVIYIVAPGYEKADFDVTVTKEKLTVSANKKKDVPLGLYAQGFSNSFNRRTEGEDLLEITGKNTKVTYDGGVLRIAIAIPEELHPEQIAVE